MDIPLPGLGFRYKSKLVETTYKLWIIINNFVLF